MKKISNEKAINLENRLIEFGLQISELVELLPASRLGNHVAGQLLRSGTSPAFNYGEAQVAESKNDFIHKMKVCLKELKETGVALQFVVRKPLVKDPQHVNNCIDECRQLIAIFITSINTAKRNY